MKRYVMVPSFEAPATPVLSSKGAAVIRPDYNLRHDRRCVMKGKRERERERPLFLLIPTPTWLCEYIAEGGL